MKAAFAASTASFTSSCVEDGKIPTSSARIRRIAILKRAPLARFDPFPVDEVLMNLWKQRLLP